MTLLGQVQGSVSTAAALRIPDYFLLAGYFLLMLGIGLYFYRFMRGMKVYFSGGNKIPWWLAGVSFYMSSFSAYAFVAYSGLCFRIGWVGVTMFLVAVPATVFSAMVFAARWRRARIDSPVEFLESRYNVWVRQLFVWLGVPVGIIDDSLKLIATGMIVSVGMGMNKEWSIVISGLIIVLYTFMGGLWAVTVTDFVQFVILAVAVVVVFPLSIAKVGGFAALVHNAPNGFFAWTNTEYNWVYIVLLIGIYCVAFSSTNWYLIQKYFCVATEKDARKVGWLVAALYVVGPPLILVPAICAQQYLPIGMDDKEVYPRLCAELLPVGMLGLVIAAMFSSTMGNLSSHFNVRASVLTNDVYRRLIRPKSSDRELVTAGRAMTLVVGCLTTVLAVSLCNATAQDLFKYMVNLFGAAVAPLGLPMLVGLITRRVTARAAVAAVVVGFGVGVILFVTLPEKGDLVIANWFNRDLGPLLSWHWQKETLIFAVNMVVTLLMLFGLSAIWPMGAAESQRVGLFHRRLATPVGDLPEERAAKAASDREKAVSPFGVVGACVLAIGVMMLCVQPFIPYKDDKLPMLLNLALGGALIVIGGLMTWGSSRARQALALARQAATAAEPLTEEEDGDVVARRD
jgi:SSS family transporter